MYDLTWYPLSAVHGKSLACCVTSPGPQVCLQPDGLQPECHVARAGADAI